MLFVFCTHSIGRLAFSSFRDIFLLRKYGYKQLKHPLRLLIYLCQMSVQRSGSQQIVIPNFVILLQIPPVSLSPNSDFNFFFGWYFQIGKFIIALPGDMCRLTSS